MNKDRQPDWQDTNMANFGSDIEKKIKAAAADGEPQWDGAGIKVGIQIWRIEQFKVKPWPKNKNGQFHKGDSYIILNTYVKDPKVNKDKLAWDIHFWIGSESTQDEYGTAAYKTVELDDKLGGEPVQHRETEGGETDLFKSYFRGGAHVRGSNPASTGRS
jgi:gelsolin